MIRRFSPPLIAALLIATPLTAQQIDRPSPIPLDPAGGDAVGYVFEAWLSPHQEGGEEEETPAFIPPVFRSTAP